MRSSRATRVVRGSVAATVATFVALMSHVAGGGTMPGWVGIVVPLVLSSIICIALAGKRLGAIRTTVAVAISQVLFHTIFVLGVTSGSSEMIGHHHGPIVMMTSETAPMIHADPGMWLWHALAAAVTVAYLLRGERSLATIRSIGTALLTRVRRVIVALAAFVSAPSRSRITAQVFFFRTVADEPFIRVSAGRAPPIPAAL